MLVVKHPLFLSTTTTTLLSTDFLSTLLGGRFAFLLFLENELREHSTRKPAIKFATPRLPALHRETRRTMRETDDGRGLVRLLSARATA